MEDGTTKLTPMQERALEDFVTIWPAMSDEQRKSAMRMLVRMRWNDGFRWGMAAAAAVFILLVLIA